MARRNQTSSKPRQIIDFAGRKCGNRQGARHLNQFNIDPLFLKKSSIFCNKDVQEGDTEGRVGEPDPFGLLGDCWQGELPINQDEQA